MLFLRWLIITVFLWNLAQVFVHALILASSALLNSIGDRRRASCERIGCTILKEGRWVIYTTFCLTIEHLSLVLLYWVHGVYSTSVGLLFRQSKRIRVAGDSRCQSGPRQAGCRGCSTGVCAALLITIDDAWHVLFQALHVIVVSGGCRVGIKSRLVIKVLLFVFLRVDSIRNSCLVFWEHFKFKWFDLSRIQAVYLKS